MIRSAEQRDIPRLLELAAGNDVWQFGSDLFGVMVVTDEQDQPVMAMGAWQLAVVHVLVDRKAGSPAERLEQFTRLHREMELSLYGLGVRNVVTWFSEESKVRGFLRRLLNLGWVRSEQVSWHRRVDGKH